MASPHPARVGMVERKRLRMERMLTGLREEELVS